MHYYYFTLKLAKYYKML